MLVYSSNCNNEKFNHESRSPFREKFSAKFSHTDFESTSVIYVLCNHISRQKIAKEIYNQFNFWHIECFITEVSIVLKGTPSSVAKTSMWTVGSQYAVPSTEYLKCKKHRINQSNKKDRMQPNFPVSISSWVYVHMKTEVNSRAYTGECTQSSLGPDIISDVSSQHTGQPIWVHTCMQRGTCPSWVTLKNSVQNFSCKLLLLKQSI